ncbi:hypothetical protein [Romboutsia lituseburensis]|uniref:hypothetical protein n=1 Tax=Romboutsia lituseburensis TaxID=1537 RepID=UPI00215A77A2|nr:hypothetical protein [Romboutsia lituseburensis]MCR8744746.1 hypothetical protein [Romboutsia lituseburensis]
MAFQKEVPIYLQVRRSVFQNIGINITDPYDYTQVVPFVTCFINTVKDQYFKVCVNEATKSYDYNNPDCKLQKVKVYYKLDELLVGGASPYNPVLYASNKGLLATSYEFTGIEQNLGCYPVGTAPITPTNFSLVFKPYSESDPNDPNKFIVYELMGPEPHPFIVLDNAPGYDAISFVADDETAPPATVSGYYIFRVCPLVEIQVNP